MEIRTKIYLDALTENSVTVKSQRYIVVEGEEMNIGEIHAKAYPNGEGGRTELMAELPEPFVTAVLAVWGDAPTVEETVIP